MTNSNAWSTPQLMADWFNQLDEPDTFFKENGYSRFPFIQDSITLNSEHVQITLSTAKDLERQQNYIDLGCQKKTLFSVMRQLVLISISKTEISKHLN